MYIVLYRFNENIGGCKRGFSQLQILQAIDGDFYGLKLKYKGFRFLEKFKPGGNVVIARGIEALDLVDELNRLVRAVEPDEVDLVQRFRNLALNCFGDDMEIHYESD